MRARVQVEMTWMFTTDEESVGQDYERDWLVGLDHERVRFVGAQGSAKT